MGRREVEKHELDVATAGALGVRRSLVGKITREFLWQLRTAAVDTGVHLQGLGHFRVLRYRVRWKAGRETWRFALRFKPARAVQQQARAAGMEEIMGDNDEEMSKFGVETSQHSDEYLGKIASSGCPRCGAAADKLQKHGSVLRCPKCGTAPFEKLHRNCSKPDDRVLASEGAVFLFPGEHWRMAQKNIHGESSKDALKRRNNYLKKLNNDVGHAAIRPANMHNNPSYLRVPTGIMPLDLDLGGGFPAGCLSLIGGPYGTGKTKMLNRIMRMHQHLYGESCSILLACSEFAPDHMFMRKCGLRVAVPEKTLASIQESRKQNKLPQLTKDELNELRSQTGIIDTLWSENGEEVLDTVLGAYRERVYSIILIDSISALQSKAQREQEHLDDTVKRAAHATMLTQWSTKLLAMSAEGENSTTVIATSQVRAADKSKLPSYMAAKARDWELTGAEAVKHANQITLLLSDGQKVRASSKKAKAAAGVADSNEKAPVIGKTMNWEIKKGKSGTHDGIRGEYPMMYDAPAAQEDLESVVAEAFRLGVLVENRENTIDMYHGATKQPTEWLGIPDRDTLLQTLASTEDGELALRNEVLAAAGLSVLYRL